MILTVTLNPAIDISYPLERLTLNTTNRVVADSKTAGGKGLNVARVLHLLGQPVLATGLLGGSLGAFIKGGLDQEGMAHDFLETEFESRICIAILHENQQQTEILESGPTFKREHETAFLKHFEALLHSQPIDVVTISGSLPQGISTTIYQKMIALANEKGLKVILDSSGEALKESLLGEALPFAIKPNEEEIATLVNAQISSEEELITALKQEVLAEIPLILVSLGAKGALAKVGTDFYRVRVPRIAAVSPVGSGDATVAGLASALGQEKTTTELLKTAMTTGILNTLEKKTGYIETKHFQKYYDLVSVTKL